MNKNRNLSIACLSILVALSACAKIEKEDPSEYEKLSLEAWIRQHRPHLQDNYQPVGARVIGWKFSTKETVSLHTSKPTCGYGMTSLSAICMEISY